MELKPIKESKKILYPTISESKKSNFMTNILLASAINIDLDPMVCAIAVPIYAPVYMPLKIVRNVTFITTVIFLLLLIKNKIKMKKSINDNEEKINTIKKHIKIDLWLFIISLIIMIISIGITFYVVKQEMAYR